VADDLLAPFRTTPAESAILLDVDGTLAPIVPHPDLSAVPDQTLRLLEDIASRYALVACVSGRAPRDVRRLVPIPAIRIAGNHGLELLDGDQVLIEEEAVPWLLAIRAVAEAVEPIAAGVGGWVEDKGATLSIHIRESDDPDAARAVLEAQAVPEILAAGLAWRWGRLALEARPPIPIDKGTAVRRLLDRHPEVRRSLYAGDDLTDLDALIAVDVRVVVQSAETPPELLPVADILVDGPAGLVEVLERLR
jgi:trehalose 6-phosphate phosphatase